MLPTKERLHTYDGHVSLSICSDVFNCLKNVICSSVDEVILLNVQLRYSAKCSRSCYQSPQPVLGQLTPAQLTSVVDLGFLKEGQFSGGHIFFDAFYESRAHFTSLRPLRARDRAAMGRAVTPVPPLYPRLNRI